MSNPSKPSQTQKIGSVTSEPSAASWVDRYWPLPKRSVPTQQDVSSQDSKKAPSTQGMWRKCTRCHALTEQTVWEAQCYVCPHCSCHARMSARNWLRHLAKGGAYTRLPEVGQTRDVLGFVDTQPYPKRVAKAREVSQETESLVTATVRIGTQPVVVAAFEFAFIGGTLGEVAGTRFAHAAAYAKKHGLPLVSVCQSGGARMQEGVLALFQMAKTSQALSLLSEQGLPHISVLADPTTGGVAASLAMQADVILAEPGALIGFTGPRVVQQTLRTPLPEGFQRAEWVRDHGAVDQVVPRKELPSLLERLVKALMFAKTSQKSSALVKGCALEAECV